MKLRLGILFGGASVEHEISILSAMQAMDHLDERRYTIIPIYVSKDRKLYSSTACRELDNFKDVEGLIKKLSPVSIFAKNNKVIVRSTSRFFQKDQELDLMLPIMHGTYGEDGSIQGYLRMLGIPFCGSDLIGAVLGQDKIIMKQILQANGIPVVDYFEINASNIEKETIMKQCTALGYPLIVKPATLGSSVGIHLVNSFDELMEALKDSFQYDRRVIVEHAISNLREFNCAVLGDEDGAQTSCVEEVLKEDEILSYHDKYEGGGKSKGMVSTSRLIPAPIDPTERVTIEALAMNTFSILQASGVVRIDFLKDETTGTIYVNEINTIPGSLSFYLFEPVGISFSELLDQLIELAIKRQRKQEQMTFTYATNVLSSFKKGSKLMK